jgi:hypothetical protein
MEYDHDLTTELVPVCVDHHLVIYDPEQVLRLAANIIQEFCQKYTLCI